MSAAGLASVIVTYHPDPRALRAQVKALSPAGAVIVVDNTEGGSPLDCEPAVVVQQGANLGVATALNRGVREARRLGAGIIALFDQDSVVDADFLHRLVATLDPSRPGVVAAVALAGSGGEYPSHRLHRAVGWRAVFAADASAAVPVDVVITSGSAATTVTYDVAGEFDDGLFIDGVDVEWCLRCRRKGVPIAVETSARLVHQIGQGAVRVPGLGTTLVHSAPRVYYKLRNPWLLARMPHCPASLACRLIVMSIIRETLVTLRHPTLRRARAALAGLRDGIRGRRGPWGAA